jgi:hypothetical protein
MIHFPLVQDFTGTADQLEFVSKELRSLEIDFTNFYKTYLDLPKETIAQLLKKESFLSSDEALSLGFATEIKEPLKAVAYYLKENTNMSKKIIALVIQDANGIEIDFPDLKDGDAPIVKTDEVTGSKAEIDSKPANGDYLRPDGETMVFDNGELIEIRPKGDEVEEVETVAVEIKELHSWELSVINETFELGDLVQYKPTEDDENPKAVSAGEFELEDGRKILVDSDGIIQFIKEVVAAPETEQISAKLNDIIAQFSAVKENLKKDNADLKAEILALKKSIGSENITITAKEQNPNTNKNKSNSLANMLRG